MIQSSPHLNDSTQVDKPTDEREVLMFSPEACTSSTHRNAPLMNAVGVRKLRSDISADYLQQIFVKTDTDNIFTMTKFHENCDTAISQYAPESVATRAQKIINKSDLQFPQQNQFLRGINILWSVLPKILGDKEMPVYASHVSLHNTLNFLWQDRCRSRQVSKPYSEISKKIHIQAACNTNSNSNNYWKHLNILADCPFFNVKTSPSECNRQVNCNEIKEIFNDKKETCKAIVLFKATDVLPEASEILHTAPTESELEQYSDDADKDEPSNPAKQKKSICGDSIYGLHYFTHKTVTGFSENPKIKLQKIKSLSQPSFPTYLVENNTDDEQSSESDNLNETFEECEDIYLKNIPTLLGTFTKDAKGSKLIEMPHEPSEEETRVLAGENAYTEESNNSDNNVNTEFDIDIYLNEFLNKSHKSHQVYDDLRFQEEKLSYPPSPNIDTSNNDHEVPVGIVQNSLSDTNIWYREDDNSLESESEISQNITRTEDHANEREYQINDKQLVSFSSSHNEITNLWNRPENKTCKMGAVGNPIKQNVVTSNIKEYWRMYGNLSACSGDNDQDENIQYKVSAVTLPSIADTSNTQVSRIVPQMLEMDEGICHLTEAKTDVSMRNIHSKYELSKKSGNISSSECITTQKTDIFTRPLSPDIMCSNDFGYQHSPIQNNHTVLPNSDQKSISNSLENNHYQVLPITYTCAQNGHSHNQMLHTQSRCTQEKQTQNVTVQTNIRSLISSWNSNYCFVCFKNNQYNNNDLKDGIHQNLALKRNIEALCLETISLRKKRRHDLLKSTNLESELPTNTDSESDESKINYGFFSNDNDGKDNFEDEEHRPELQDISTKNGQNFVDSDHKVPDVRKDISWMEDDMNQRELYLKGQIMKAPPKGEHNFEWNNSHQFLKICNNIEERVHRSHKPVKRLIHIGLSRRAQPHPLHPYRPR